MNKSRPPSRLKPKIQTNDEKSGIKDRKEGNYDPKFQMECLVVEDPHAEKRSKTAAKKGKEKEGRFGYTEASLDRLSLVNAVIDKGDQIEKKGNYKKENRITKDRISYPL